MRAWIGVVIATAALWLVLGCAGPGSRVTPAPTADELPSHAEETEPACQAVVAVQGRQAEPRIDLAPSFKEPELTPAERKALGKEEPTYKPLLFDFPGHFHPPLVGTWYGGVDTGALHRLSPTVNFTESKSLTAALLPFGGPTVGYDPRPHPGGKMYGSVPLPGTVRGESWVQIGVDRASKVARVKTRRDR